MRILPRWTRVNDELGVWISPHYLSSTFGIRGRYEATERTLPFVQGKTAGSGFFARESQSHAYRHFVADTKSRFRPNLFRLLTLQEFDFDREIDKCTRALENTDDHEKMRIIESYQSCLYIAQNAEYLQRTVNAIKKKMGHRPKKYMVSALNHTKSRIAILEKDVAASQIHVEDTVGEEIYALYAEMVKVFTAVAVSRRIWAVDNEGDNQRYTTVYFDLGIFDFIQSKYDTPILRDAQGRQILMYPETMLVARSSVDFDILPYKDVNITFEPVDITRLSHRPPLHGSSSKHRKHHHHHSSVDDAVAGHEQAQYVGRIHIDPVGVTFYVMNDRAAHDFVYIVNKLKEASA